MNATETIFAIALASNLNPQQNFKFAYQQLNTWGNVCFSPIYLIPCRDGIGADYYNAACLIKSTRNVNEMLMALKQVEHASGRVRPSHQISLDVDLIAWGKDLHHMQFNAKKLPLALDVKIPLADIWQHDDLSHPDHEFPVVVFESK